MSEILDSEGANSEVWLALLLMAMLSMALFAGGVAFSYWADEMQHPSLNARSFPAPRMY